MKSSIMELEFGKIYRTGAAAYLTEKEAVSYYTQTLLNSKKAQHNKKEAKEFVKTQLEKYSKIDERMAVTI